MFSTDSQTKIVNFTSVTLLMIANTIYKGILY